MTGKSTVNKKACLIVLVLGTSMASIDNSIVNVSLPVMRKQFSSDITGVQWVVTAYMLSFSVFIPLTDWLKNRIGYFNLYIFSTMIFLVGSLLCGLSGNLTMLVISRVIQAVGSGAITPAALAIISTVFPREERGRAMALWGLGTVLGPALGPTLGGILTQHFGWPYIFFVNLPIGLITLVLSFRYLYFLRRLPVERSPFNTTGFISLAAMLVSLQYLITNAGNVSVWGIRGMMLVLIMLLAFAVFCISSSRSRNPLIDLSLFKRTKFLNALGLVAMRSVALYGGLFLLPFLLQGSLGYSETESGLLMLPNAVILALITPFSARWADQRGFRAIVILGLMLLSASMFLFGRIDTSNVMVLIMTGMILRGAGFGLVNTPLTESVVNAVPQENVAMASSMNTLVIQLSGALGISVCSLVHQAINKKYSLGSERPLLSEHHALLDCFFMLGLLMFVAVIPALKLKGRNAKADLLI